MVQRLVISCTSKKTQSTKVILGRGDAQHCGTPPRDIERGTIMAPFAHHSVGELPPLPAHHTPYEDIESLYERATADWASLGELIDRRK